MPTYLHEALAELVRQQPQFAVDLVTDLGGVPVPDYASVTLDSPDLTETTPIEQRADGVVTLHHDDGDDGAAALGIIVEVQLEPDYKKHYTWPAYLVSLRNRLKAPVVVLVICPRPRTARWAARPIHLGGNSRIEPLVIGPADVPAITDPEVARGHPELAMLSAITHHENHAVLDALFATFTPDIERSYMYADLIRTVLPDTARTYLEQLMSAPTWQPKSDFAREYFNKGKVEDRAEALLEVLATRSIPVTDEARRRITECTDVDQLKEWFRRAITAATVDEVFGADG
ncbi:MAG: hypothetical protein KDB67_20305 [Gordonia sp.]|uniref:hypothetical protein n=1 Tax=Gordonia sp. (in: high G+C Gram-positive bacteria) TaxID=84139 RepID=UPI001E0C9FD3|nr:hypothetical protein [Gordonia sp. (in: high G+C Gram-positive bacteria)]MCB1296994.1 hypothetical protein [Gordonia sp. (in: high G+C Gram-positive bacteria)]